MSTTVAPGDKIRTVVRLSEAGDIRFAVRRDKQKFLSNVPGQLDYEDIYTVTAADSIVVYAWLFAIASDEGKYAIVLHVNDVKVDGDAGEAPASEPHGGMHVFVSASVEAAAAQPAGATRGRRAAPATAASTRGKPKQAKKKQSKAPAARRVRRGK